MTYRLAVLGFEHESNTFSGNLATLALYERDGLFRGQELVERHLTSQATLAGYLAPDETLDVELVPILSAWLNPCGPIAADAFEAITAEMAAGLADAGPLDGVLLALHGAAVAEHVQGADAEIAARMRAVVGPGVPIAVVVDMHANIDPRLLEQIDVLRPYQTNPHVDARARGVEARAALVDILTTGHRPALALAPLPLVVTITRQDTSEEPMAPLLAATRELERRPGVLDVSILEGFPYADVPHMGMSVVVTHVDGTGAAAEVAREMAATVWSARRELQGGGTSVADALAEAARHEGSRPLLILDVGDNVGGGGPGDSTILLSEAVARGVSGVVGILQDPDTVASLAGATVGDRVRVRAGGRSREQDGVPLELNGEIVGVSDGLYEEPRMAHGGLRFFDCGDTVAIRTDAGVTVVLTSKLVQPITPHQLSAVGLDPGSYRAIIAKGVNGPRAGYAEVCERFLVADTPGVTRLSVEKFPYRHRRRPLFPFEPDARFDGEVVVG